MLVNHIQIAYVLGITSKAAKIMMSPHIHRGDIKPADKIKSITSKDFVESSKLGILFHHPSPDLDGKDKIEYIILNLRGGDKPDP